MQNYYDLISGIDTSVDESVLEASFKALPETEHTPEEQYRSYLANGSTIAAAYRADQATKHVDIFSGYELPEDLKEEVNASSTAKEAEYLLGATSRDDWVHRQRKVEEDRAIAKVQHDMGWEGAGWTLAIAAADPTSWYSLMTLAPLRVFNSASRSMRALKAAGVVGLENAGLEAVFHASTTQAKPEDFVFAALGGAVIGGAIGAASRQMTPSLGRHADEADAAMLEYMDNIENTVTTAAAREAGVVDELSAVVPDGVDVNRVQRDIREMGMTLKAESSLSLKSKQIDEIYEELAFIESRRLGMDEVGNRDPKTSSTPTRETVEKLDAEARQLDSRARELEQKLDGHLRAQESAKFKKKWDSWSTKKKIKRLYSGETPNKVKAAAAQKGSVIEGGLAEAKAADPESIKLSDTERAELRAEAKEDPEVNRRLDDLVAEETRLAKKIKQDIEEKYDCVIG